MAAPSTASSMVTEPEPQGSRSSFDDSCSPMDPKKRKYEEANTREKWELYKYHQENPKLKQRELAEWFSHKFNRQINQSTVSRNLKKFKLEPPTEPGSEPGPRKRTAKSAPSQSPSEPKIHNSSRNLPPLPSSGLPPTPPPRDIRYRGCSPIDNQLYDFWTTYRQRNANASESEITAELKAEARRLYAGIRPPPPPERIDEQIVDDAWVASWKRAHGFPPPSPASFTGLVVSPRVSATHVPMDPCMSHHSLGHSDADRTPSEEPRSPVSAVSSISNRREELPPIRELFTTAESRLHSQDISRSPPHPYGTTQNQESPERLRKREIKRLTKEVEKRNIKIQTEVEKRDEVVKKIDELIKMSRSEASLHQNANPI